MATPIGRSVSPTYMAPIQPQERVSQPISSEPSIQTLNKLSNTQASFSAARQSVVGKSTETVNPSQGGQQVRHGIEQGDGGQLLKQGQSLLESPRIKQEFGAVSSTPQTSRSGITPDMLVQARKNLKPVSQHQVLNLGDVSTGSATKESTISRKLGTAVGGVSLEKGLLPGPNGSIDIVGHSSDGGMKIEGKSPQQLAKLLKDNFDLKKIKTINLVSCESEKFKAEFHQALSDLGIEVGNVESAKGRAAVDRATGKLLDEAVDGDLNKLVGHDGPLGKTISNLDVHPQNLFDSLSGINGLQKPTVFQDAEEYLNSVQSNPANLKQFVQNLIRISKTTYPDQAARYDFLQNITDDVSIEDDHLSMSAQQLYDKNLVSVHTSRRRPSDKLNNHPNHVFLKYLEQVHGVDAKGLMYALGAPVAKPGSGGLGSLEIGFASSIKGRPAFASYTQSILPTPPGMHKRHITAWHTMRGAMQKYLESPVLTDSEKQQKFKELWQNSALPLPIKMEAIKLITGKDIRELIPLNTPLTQLAQNSNEQTVRNTILNDPQAQQAFIPIMNEIFSGLNLNDMIKTTLFSMNSNPRNLWVGDGNINQQINTAFNTVNKLLESAENAGVEITQKYAPHNMSDSQVEQAFAAFNPQPQQIPPDTDGKRKYMLNTETINMMKTLYDKLRLPGNVTPITQAAKEIAADTLKISLESEKGPKETIELVRERLSAMDVDALMGPLSLKIADDMSRTFFPDPGQVAHRLNQTWNRFDLNANFVNEVRTLVNQNNGNYDAAAQAFNHNHNSPNPLWTGQQMSQVMQEVLLLQESNIASILNGNSANSGEVANRLNQRWNRSDLNASFVDEVRTLVNQNNENYDVVAQTFNQNHNFPNPLWTGQQMSQVMNECRANCAGNMAETINKYTKLDFSPDEAIQILQDFHDQKPDFFALRGEVHSRTGYNMTQDGLVNLLRNIKQLKPQPNNLFAFNQLAHQIRGNYPGITGQQIIDTVKIFDNRNKSLTAYASESLFANKGAFIETGRKLFQKQFGIGDVDSIKYIDQFKILMMA